MKAHVSASQDFSIVLILLAYLLIYKVLLSKLPS